MRPTGKIWPGSSTLTYVKLTGPVQSANTAFFQVKTCEVWQTEWSFMGLITNKIHLCQLLCFWPHFNDLADRLLAFDKDCEGLLGGINTEYGINLGSAVNLIWCNKTACAKTKNTLQNFTTADYWKKTV